MAGRRSTTTVLHIALLVVVAVPLASCLFFAAELASAGVTWRGDPDEAYGLEVGGLPAALPRWVSVPVGFVMVLSTLSAPLLALVCLPGSLVVARTEREHARRTGPVTVVIIVLSAALAVLVLAWGDELLVWVLD